MSLERGGRDSSAQTSGVLGRPSGKAILLNLPAERPVRPTHPDALDAHFVVADVIRNKNKAVYSLPPRD